MRALSLGNKCYLSRLAQPPRHSLLKVHAHFDCATLHSMVNAEKSAMLMLECLVCCVVAGSSPTEYHMLGCPTGQLRQAVHA